MSKETEKASGVFVIKNKKEKLVYVGKSKSLGGTIRAVKSKLNSGKFSNNFLQEDYSESKFVIETIPLVDGDDLAILHRDTIKSYDEKKWFIYNNTNYIEVKGEDIKTDKYGMDELDSPERSIVSTLVDAFKEGKATVNDVRKALSGIQIYEQ